MKTQFEVIEEDLLNVLKEINEYVNDRINSGEISLKQDGEIHIYKFLQQYSMFSKELLDMVKRECYFQI